MPKLLTAKEACRYKEDIIRLFAYCKLASSHTEVEYAFCERKFGELIDYINADRAYLFAEEKDGALIGFLWACPIMREDGERFHILYFSVLESEQGRGVGRALIALAEETAARLGFPSCELNVHKRNESAIRFYDRDGWHAEKDFSEEKFTLVKKIGR